MPDVITVIIQGIDRLTGTADKATSNLRREVAELKTELGDAQGAERFTHQIEDLNNAMDPGGVVRLRKAYQDLKNEWSDPEAAQRFQRVLQDLGPSIDADGEALTKFTRAQKQLDGQIADHIDRLLEWKNQNRAVNQSLEDLGRGSEDVGVHVEALTHRVERMKQAMSPGQARLLEAELQRLLASTGQSQDFDRFSDRLERFNTRARASSTTVVQFRNALEDARIEITKLRRDVDNVGSIHVDAGALRTAELDAARLARQMHTVGEEVSEDGGKFDRLTSHLDEVTRGMNRVPAERLRTEFDHLMSSAGNTSDFESFDSALDRVNSRTRISETNLAAWRQGLTALRSDVDELRSTFRGFDSELESMEHTTRAAASDAEALGKDLGVEAENLSGLGDRVTHVKTEHDLLGRSVEAAGEEVLKLGEDAARVGEHDVAALGRSVIGLAGSLGRLAVSWVQNQVASAQTEGVWSTLTSTGQGLATNVFGALTRAAAGITPSLGVMNVLIAAAIVLFPVLTAAVQVLAGVLVAAGGTVVAFASALSVLVGLLVVIPAAIIAAIGAFGAFFLAFMGPLQQIIQGVQFLRQQQSAQRAAQNTTGTSDPVAQAEQNLAFVRQQNQEQLRLQEQEYHDLVVRDRQQEADAQENLIRVRQQAAQRLLQAEQQLAAIRAQNNATRQQFEENLALARAALANADTAIGRQIAQGDVANAQGQLNQFNRTANQQQRQAQDNVDQIRKQNLRDIHDAEVRLHRIEMDNIRQELEARERLAQTVQNNLHQEAGAAQAVQQAQTGLGSGATAARRNWEALSPAVQRVAREVFGLWQLIQRTLAPVRNEFLNFISEIVVTLRRNIGPISQIIRDFADAILGTLRQGFNMIRTDPTLRRALSIDFREGAGGIRILGDAFLHLAAGIIRVTSAAGPLLDFLVQGFDHFARWVDKAAASAVASGEMAHFFGVVRDVVGQLITIFKNLFIAFFNVFKIGFGPGDSLLEGLVRLSRRFRDFTATARGQNEIKRFFQDAIDTGKALFDLIGAIIGGIGKLGRDEIRRPLTTRLEPGAAGRAGVDQAQGPSGLTTGLQSAASAVPKIVTFIEAFNQQHGAEVRTFIRDIFQLVGAFVRFEIVIQPVVTLIFKLLDVLVRILTNRLIEDLILGILGLSAAIFGLTFGLDAVLFILSPEGLIFVAIAALLIGIVELIRHFHDIVAAMRWLYDRTREIFTGILRFLHDTWLGRIIALLSGELFAEFVIRGLLRFFRLMATAIRDGAGGIVRLFRDWFSGVIHIFGDWFTLLGDLVHGRWHKIWKDFKNIAHDELQLLVNLFVDFVNLLGSLVSDSVNLILAPFRHIGGFIGGLLGHVGVHIPNIPTIHIPAIPQVTLPNFAEGGPVGDDERRGDPVQVIAHIGEWILNDDQQMRVARLLGGLENAKRYLFQTPFITPKLAFAAGGPVASSGALASGPQFLMPLTINTASPNVDIDYVMRVAEMRVREAMAKT